MIRILDFIWTGCVNGVLEILCCIHSSLSIFFNLQLSVDAVELPEHGACLHLGLCTFSLFCALTAMCSMF